METKKQTENLLMLNAIISKTNSKATHSIKEIIPANLSYCKNFTELDGSLPIMYSLTKMH